MARKIPTEMVQHIVKSSPRTEYNWDQYADGEWWELRKGDDYQVQTSSARASVARWAESEGYEAELANLKEHDGFVLRFKRK
jgi:hypothetical protein